MLKINNLKKHYGTLLALNIPHLEFQENIYWIKGQNGSGKSTLLKCLAGLLSFNGDVLFDNTSLKKKPENYLQLVNYSPTEPIYPDFLIGYHLLDFFVKSKNTKIDYVIPMIKCFDMEEYIYDQPISQYSSGMLKKLSILLAFAGNVKLVLLDEPYITLDLEASAFLSDWICQFKKNNGIIIMTSHLDSLPFPAKEIQLNKGIIVKSKV
ncbi:ABC transporter ATP-binding protein [Sphingobacterium sp. HJSM2_6]|uniref:ABC transporter ATP-binding protein n=1 Tax=Sphingobacterium sp. HJSM2_6 TaxID=3366264 RepID=UPI003BCC018D